MAAVISPDDIRAMFAGLSRTTINVILRGARAEFMQAVRKINADGRPITTTDIMEPFRITPVETATCVIVGSPADIAAYILTNGDDLEHTLRIPLSLTTLSVSTPSVSTTSATLSVSTPSATPSVSTPSVSTPSATPSASTHSEHWTDWIEAVLGEITARWNPRIIRCGRPSTDATLQSTGGVTLFTDGGATNNGKSDCRASWAWIAVTPDGIVARGSGLVPISPSNNRGELTAIGGAVNWIEESKTMSATIVSDSKLSIDTLTKWVIGWLAEPKKLAKRKNLDIIIPIHDCLTRLAGRGVTVQFRHVNSHRAEPGDTEGKFLWRGNDIVDRECERLLL